MKIWTVTINDDSGDPTATVHKSLEEAKDAAHEWISHYFHKFPLTCDLSQDFADLYEEAAEFGYLDGDTCQIEEHEIQL